MLTHNPFKEALSLNCSMTWNTAANHYRISNQTKIALYFIFLQFLFPYTCSISSNSILNFIISWIIAYFYSFLTKYFFDLYFDCLFLLLLRLLLVKNVDWKENISLWWLIYSHIVVLIKMQMKLRWKSINKTYFYIKRCL